MAELNGFQKVMRRVTIFFNNAVRQIKKGDKRFIIMAASALVLVLILLILIIHGVSAGKKTKEPNTVTPIVPETTTEDPMPLPVVNPDKTGKYRVNTSSESPLNMRLAADRTTEKIGSIPNNTEVEVLFVDESSVTASGEYGWGYVEYNGKRGWVSMEYLTPAN